MLDRTHSACSDGLSGWNLSFQAVGGGGSLDQTLLFHLIIILDPRLGVLKCCSNKNRTRNHHTRLSGEFRLRFGLITKRVRVNCSSLGLMVRAVPLRPGIPTRGHRHKPFRLLSSLSFRLDDTCTQLPFCQSVHCFVHWFCWCMRYFLLLQQEQKKPPFPKDVRFSCASLHPARDANSHMENMTVRTCWAALYRKARRFHSVHPYPRL